MSYGRIKIIQCANGKRGEARWARRAIAKLCARRRRRAEDARAEREQ